MTPVVFADQCIHLVPHWGFLLHWSKAWLGLFSSYDVSFTAPLCVQLQFPLLLQSPLLSFMKSSLTTKARRNFVISVMFIDLALLSTRVVPGAGWRMWINKDEQQVPTLERYAGIVIALFIFAVERSLLNSSRESRYMWFSLWMVPPRVGQLKGQAEGETWSAIECQSTSRVDSMLIIYCHAFFFAI